MKNGSRATLTAASLVVSVMVPAIATAQERSAVSKGFSLPADGSARILVLRPRIRVGAQSTGGGFEPRDEWTRQAREHVDAAVSTAQPGLGFVKVEPGEAVGDDARLLSEYQALFAGVAKSVITYQFFVGNRLETKKRDNHDGNFDWTLGTEISKIPGARDADYILFLNTEDHYGSTGRKMLQIVAALSVGYGVQSGLHAGYAGLVDARTGRLVWINADNQMGGDVRTVDGATRRISQLLEDFPGRRRPPANSAGVSSGAVAGAAR